MVVLMMMSWTKILILFMGMIFAIVMTLLIGNLIILYKQNKKAHR